MLIVLVKINLLEVKNKSAYTKRLGIAFQGSQLPEAGTNAMVVLCDAYPLRINKAAEVTCFEFV